MKRFLIGQYGGFDEDKYTHDFRNHFYGIEACLFEDETSISRLIEEKSKQGFEVGVHYPFFNNSRRKAQCPNPLRTSIDQGLERGA